MQKIEWDKLGFEFTPTKSNLRFTYKDGKWDDGELFDTYDITVSVVANAFHYGQAIFEGLKAFTTCDNRVCVFRPEANAARINSSARHLLMPEFPEDKFVEAVKRVVADNIDYVPPYGTGGSLYIRPVMFGITPQIGVSPSKEYMMVFIVTPVGAYYKGGLTPVEACISVDFDRAAPHGTGHIKAAGNYAAGMLSTKIAKEKHHCPVALFLDPATHTMVDEFGTSNFLAITKDGKYITPDSKSVLPSITNNSLMQVAQDLGITVERRPVMRAELGDLAEVAACGTAVVITPVSRIYDGDKVYEYGDKVGATMQKIYDTLTGIQNGLVPDAHNWLTEVTR